MTYLADLSPYQYAHSSIPDGVTCWAVGWLERGHPFPTGDVPDGFVERLGQLCLTERRARMRGFHVCSLGGHPTPVYEGDPTIPVPASVEIDGTKVSVGNGEVRVITDDGTWLAAPTMILHYVTEHAYLPPEPFVEAVMAGRVAPECGG